jgi:hypothetical protein
VVVVDNVAADTDLASSPLTLSENTPAHTAPAARVYRKIGRRGIIGGEVS